MTPLHLAIHHNRKEVMMWLVQKLSVEGLCVQNSQGKTPLELATECNDIHTIEWLVGKNLLSKELAKALRLALQYDDTKVISTYKHGKIVDLLLIEARIAPDDLLIKDSQGRAPLHLAILNNDWNAVELIVRKLGQKPAIMPEALLVEDNKGRILIELAIREKHQPTFKLLIDRMKEHCGIKLTVKTLFGTNGYSLFSCGYLPKHRNLAGLLRIKGYDILTTFG